MSQETPKQMPECEFRAGRIRASVWRNETQQDDRVIANFSVTVQKRFKDEQSGEWRDTNIFFSNELPRLSLVAQKAFEYVTLKTEDNAF